MEISKDDLLEKLQQNIYALENKMLESLGMQLYKSPNGFSQEDIYKLCGRDDSVTTITLKPDSEGFRDYGDTVTLVFVYTPKERTELENDSASLNNISYVKAKALLPDYDTKKAEALLHQGINTFEIIEMLVLPGTKPKNLYYSPEKRSPNVMEIPFQARGNGQDIYWMYGALASFIEKGIAITPDEYNDYLAYKIVIDKDSISKEEHEYVFNKQGQIHNNKVGLAFLKWKQEADLLSEKDKHNLNHLMYLQITERLRLLDNMLNGVGGLIRFSKKYPEKAKLIVDKALHFRQHRYNHVGKHLLYLDLEGFLHIYLRHVEELNAAGLYPQKTKFQLKEKDVEIVIDHVLNALNDEYQIFRETYPDREYRKYAEEAFYYNGDYYSIRVAQDGRLIQFFKLSDRS